MPIEYKFFGNLAKNKPVINCVIGPRLLPSGGIGVICGEPGVGKSFMALQTCVEIASGRRWLGLFPVNRLKVAYIDLEKMTAVDEERWYLKAWQHKDIWDRLIHATGSFFVDTKSGKADLVEFLIDNLELRVIVIDSFPKTVLLEEELKNFKLALSAYREICRDFGVSFIIVHHLRKLDFAFNYRTGKFTKRPPTLDDIPGYKYLGYEVDLVVLLFRAGNRRYIRFLKHSHSSVDYGEGFVLEFNFQPTEPHPFVSSHPYWTAALEHIDKGVRTSADLQKSLNLSKPTTLKILSELESMGLVKLTKAHGNIPTTIEPIKTA